MIRRLALLGAALLTLAPFTPTTAGAATTTAPNGVLHCGFAPSTSTFTPALPGAGQPRSKGGVSLKIKNAGTSGCDTSQVTGGAAKLKSALVNFTTKTIPNVNCATVRDFGLKVVKPKLTVTLVDVAGHKTTITPVNVTVGTVVDFGAVVSFTMTGSILASAKPVPFAGKTFHTDIAIANPGDVAACSAPGSTTSLTHIAFSAPTGFDIG